MSTTPLPQTTLYKAFKVRYHMTLSDPDMPSPRYHTIIFIETNKDLSGHVHHVIGDIVTGMKYQSTDRERPETDEAFFDKEFIGYVASETYPKAVDDVCERLPPPPKQKGFNVRTMRTEPMRPDGTFYGIGEARPSLIKCTEWTEGQAIPTLRQSGVLLDSV
ncbi:hypothetical protein M409DRAFT_26630 [Zasmidium cellare ATCC 36951]|uniref:Uncharacterized protein n=1 Tax=Zasmidium cellare ATCC 36951 TaxID=1080233 RepID=A0A6A6C7M4_ZASCE|nr:uncharacterized protein M409DRAFT_26630 [Zasmidium cellare ATCC 36951]KAF2163187.1 hypothetical protein M409DRAFT_26630 [Zasmidium cellare ATCC 36951]